MIRDLIAISVLTCILQIAADAQPKRKKTAPVKRAPVIDMHIHASPLSEFGGGGIPVCTGDQRVILPAIDPKVPFNPKDLITCVKPLTGPKTDGALMSETLAELKRHNVKRAVAMGDLDLVSKWTYSGSGMYIPALDFSGRETSVATYRQHYKEGKFKMFGELGPQYRGFAPADPAYAEYFALAEELDIPVGIHLGEGPPGGIHLIGPPTYRVKLGSPLLLEELIVRHPKLRIYVMHYGSPLVDEMIAMMFSHSNLYVDVSCNNWAFPRKQFYDQLERMINAGFEKRIMFGSDQMAWPAAIGKAIETIENAPFLSPEQKRDIFYNNAARFLRLTKEEMAEDHR